MIDIRTLILAAALANLMLAGLLLSFGRSSALQHAGVLWTRAKFALGVGWSLLWLRGIAPDLVSALLGNLMLLTGLALEVAAVLAFLHRRPQQRQLWVVWGAAMVIWLGTFAAGAAPAAMVMIASSLATVFLGWVAYALATPWKLANPLMRFIAATYALTMLLSLVRVLQASQGEGFALMTGNSIQAALFLALFVFTLTNGFGFLLLAQQESDAALRRAANVDALTEALNRRSFEEVATNVLQRCETAGRPAAALMLDLDGFKQVNDRHGHRGGDVVLRVFADECRQRLRQGDALGRLGGEEFAAILSGADFDAALGAANRLCRGVAARQMEFEGRTIQVTVSIGVVMARRGEALESILVRADRALYDAKARGRNQVVGWPD